MKTQAHRFHVDVGDGSKTVQKDRGMNAQAHHAKLVPALPRDPDDDSEGAKCQATARPIKGPPHPCGNPPMYEINGRRYCYTHAAAKALRLLLDEAQP